LFQYTRIFKKLFRAVVFDKFQQGGINAMLNQPNPFPPERLPILQRQTLFLPPMIDMEIFQARRIPQGGNF